MLSLENTKSTKSTSPVVTVTKVEMLERTLKIKRTIANMHAPSVNVATTTKSHVVIKPDGAKVVKEAMPTK